MHKIYERQAELVHAWRVPLTGTIAEEQAPDWLVTRLIEGLVTINSYGGLSYPTTFGVLSCLPGDYIILSEADRIEFCPADEFFDKYSPLDQRQAA